MCLSVAIYFRVLLKTWVLMNLEVHYGDLCYEVVSAMHDRKNGPQSFEAQTTCGLPPMCPSNKEPMSWGTSLSCFIVFILQLSFVFGLLVLIMLFRVDYNLIICMFFNNNFLSIHIQVVCFAMVMRKDADIGLVVGGKIHKKNHCVHLRVRKAIELMVVVRHTQLGLFYSGLGL